ncbi:MAG: tRNA lysidine(34) synthetase TilS [Fusobacterium sp.]
MNVIDKVIKKIEKEKLVKKNDRIVLGCSGGPDSIFLLEVFLKIRKKYNLTLALAHINHLYRGDFALRDEIHVRKTGEKYDIPVFVRKKSMENLAKDKKITLEEAGREIRYSFFDEVLEKIDGNKVALAHNLDDQVETFLFRMMRGTSLEGLEGIANIRGKFIRPINEVYKKDVLNYLDMNNISYMLDHTNFENEYTRNSIRIDLIPFIEKRYNPKFKEKIFNLMEEIKEVNNFIEIDYDKYIDGNKLNGNIVLSENSYIQKKIINKFLNLNNIQASRRKIENIFELLVTSGSKKIKLDKDYTLLKEYDRIIIVKNKTQEKEIETITLKIPGEIIFGNYIISANLVGNKDQLDKNSFITTLKNEDELLIRSRKVGDRIKLKGLDYPKKVKDIMINSKIPKFERENIPIILHNNEIVCIGGIKKSEKYISEDKKGIVVLNVRRKEC